MRLRLERLLCGGLLLGLLVSARAAHASPLDPLYLRAETRLVAAAPTATVPRDDVTAFIGAGERIVLAEFVSDPAADTLFATSATVRLYLVTGRTGMDGCADIFVEVARRTPPDERVVLGTGVVSGSIMPRRDTVDPIEIPVELQQPLVAPGDRLALAVAIGNRCDDARGPVLLYDALGFASAIRFGTPPPTTTTTTTVAPTSTTTTVPPADCLFQPLAGYEAVWCRIDTLAATLSDELPDALGGAVAVGRLERRLARTRDLLRSAQAGDHPHRALRRALAQLAAIDRMVRRGQRRGRIDADVGAELTDLVAGAAGEIARVR